MCVYAHVERIFMEELFDFLGDGVIGAATFTAVFVFILNAIMGSDFAVYIANIVTSNLG